MKRVYIFLFLLCLAQTVQAEPLLQGNTVLNTDSIKQIIDQQPDSSDLTDLAEKLSELYANNGYITSKVVVQNNQLIAIEGTIERVDIKGNQRLSADYIRSRFLLNQPPVLNIKAIASAVQLLNTDPTLQRVTVSLERGSQPNQTIVELAVQETNLITGSATTDNLVSQALGNLRYQSALTLHGSYGDQFTTNYVWADGLQYWDWQYQIPLNPLNGTITLRFTPSSFRVVTPPFNVLDIQGYSRSYDLTYRQPLHRSFQNELALSIGWNKYDGETFILNNIPLAPTTNTNALKLGWDYLDRSLDGAWFIKSELNFNTTSVVWNNYIQRVQFFTPDLLLTLSLNGQLASYTTPPPYQFTAGINPAINGDSGLRTTVELRYVPIPNTLSIAPFFDFATTANSNLATTGITATLSPSQNLNIKLIWNLPLSDQPNYKPLSFSINLKL